jgi:hypothetical protein
MYKMLQILQWCPQNPSFYVLCTVSELDVLQNVMHVLYLMLSIEGFLSRQECVVWISVDIFNNRKYFTVLFLFC